MSTLKTPLSRAELVDRIVEGLRQAGMSLSRAQLEAMREAGLIAIVAADGRRITIDCATGEITFPEPPE